MCRGIKMEERIIDNEIVLVPYYPAYEETFAWYQDTDVCKQVDNIDHVYTMETLEAMYTFLSTHGSCYYIQYKGKLVGDVTLRDNHEICIVVCKEYQNKHIGRRCVLDMLKLAKEKGYEEVKANIYSFNTQSRKMFLSVGFEKIADEWYQYSITDTAHYHLPGLFEFYELYKLFLPLFYGHREYFYDWCDIGSIYGAPADCIWGGGRAGFGDAEPREALALAREYGISARLTFSNSLLTNEHLADKKCNNLCAMLEKSEGVQNGVIVHSDLLLEYLKKNYPGLYFVSSTTKVLTDFGKFRDEVKREDFKYVVPDFRLNKAFDKLDTLSDVQKDKVEFLCNECCWFGCNDRKECYENVSRKNLGEGCPDHICTAPNAKEGYRFSKAMENPGFIGIEDIRNTYLPMGFSNFKIEGRGLGSALILEFLLYYMTKPEYQLKVREEIYLDGMLDLF